MAYSARTSEYIYPSDPLVQEKLSDWRDLKFGLMMHWAPYSLIGALESWSICSEPVDWISRPMSNYEEYKRFYQSLYKVFNPLLFEPREWAQLARKSGVKYVIPTSKHHDGFCMFDSRQTDYKITSPHCPFHSHPRANILYHVLEAFREEEMKAGIYFSKPDWNCEYYWWPYYATPDRHVNYNPASHPDLWAEFKSFTYNQIEELMTGYGPIDILWFDGAWVRPLKNMPSEYKDWAQKNDWDQDIDMPNIASMARRHQPGLIIVDRWVAGEYENYLTPEQSVPDEYLPYPWEANMTMTSDWSFRPGEQYKTSREILYTLVDVVSKGGNFLLNIGPKPDGTWPDQACRILSDIGEWLSKNGESIYSTLPLYPYIFENLRFTKSKNGAIYCHVLNDSQIRDQSVRIEIPAAVAEGVSAISLLGSGQKLGWQFSADKIIVNIPAEHLHHECRTDLFTIKLAY